MDEMNEWKFSFGLFAKEENKLVSEEECDALLNVIIDHVESVGLSIGGGFGAFSDAESSE